MKNNTYYTDVMESWLRDKKAEFARSTYSKYRRICNKYITPFFADIKIENINSITFEDYRNFLNDHLLTGDPGAGNETAKCASMLVNRIMAYAKEQKLLETVPKFTWKSHPIRKEVTVFTEAEQYLIEEFCIKNKDIYSMGILLCLYTGMRIGELCALKWNDIDVEEEIIHINRTVQRLDTEEKKSALIVSYPKSRSSVRNIPIPKCILDVLLSFYAYENSTAYIFTGKENVPAEPRTFQYRYRKYLEKAGVKYRKFHTLRHTFATRCIHCGIDIKTLSEILGHSNVKITLEYYCHTTMEQKKKQMNRLSLLSHN